MIAMIVAHDPQLVIGKDGWMPWNIPEDLALFKQTTLNHTILFGRKTFESINKVLPKRKTVVLTRDVNYRYEHPDVTIINDVSELLKKYANSEEILFICGGAEIYKLCIDYVQTIYVSEVKKSYEGDTYLIDYRQYDFEEELEVEYNEFNFKIYERVKK